MIMKKIIFLIIILFCFLSSLYPAFENEYWGSRAKGMAGCFTAIADDYSAPMWNPAGLDNLYSIGLQLMYSKPFLGFDDEFKMDNYFFSLCYPDQRLGCFSLTYTRFSVTDLYFEDTYTLSYGINMNQFFNSLSFYWQIGLNLRLFSLGFSLDKRTENDAVFKNGTSSKAFGVDFGTLISPFYKKNQNHWTIGLTIFNLNDPKIGLSKKETINKKYAVGLAYDIHLPQYSRSLILVPAVQMTELQGNTDFIFGAEIWMFNKLIGLRGGRSGNEIALGMSVNLDIHYNFKISTDYAFLSPSHVQDTLGTHLFSLSIKFPGLTSKLNKNSKTKNKRHLKYVIRETKDELQIKKSSTNDNQTKRIIRDNKNKIIKKKEINLMIGNGNKNNKIVMINKKEGVNFNYYIRRRGDVSVQIFNIRGDLIKTLVNTRDKRSGYYKVYWNGRSITGRLVESGIYFIRIVISENEEVKRIVFLK